MKKIITILLGISCILVLSGCQEQINHTEGEINNMKYKETSEKTNVIKIEMMTDDIIIIELNEEVTPITVSNFQKLISEKFYDGLTFHRVVKNFMIQGGDPSGNGTGGSKETIKGEFSKNGVNNTISHKRGVISMARSQNMDSASSQFFICDADSTFLDGDYAAFGNVIAGMETVDKIANEKVNGETPVKKIVIKSIRFVEIEK